jgi:hypothetical protein
MKAGCSSETWTTWRHSPKYHEDEQLFYPEHGGSRFLQKYYVYQTTRRHIQKDFGLNVHCRKNLKSHNGIMEFSQPLPRWRNASKITTNTHTAFLYTRLNGVISQKNIILIFSSVITSNVVEGSRSSSNPSPTYHALRIWTQPHSAHTNDWMTVGFSWRILFHEIAVVNSFFQLT